MSGVACRPAKKACQNLTKVCWSSGPREMQTLEGISFICQNKAQARWLPWARNCKHLPIQYIVFESEFINIKYINTGCLELFSLCNL